jgi:hypothetical protein
MQDEYEKKHKKDEVITEKFPIITPSKAPEV